MFDQLTIERLDFYVYTLINPIDNKPFYIGKGTGNRVFNHQSCAIKDDYSNLKLDIIREIIEAGQKVEHIIVRHGLTEKEAFEIEASLIDFGNKFGFEFSNIVLGHHSNAKGLMTSDEIVRIYNAEPLIELLHPVIIININKKYTRGNSSQDIYKSTKEAWTIDENRTRMIKYALSEFSGIVIEVFEIHEWYKIEMPNNKIRWGFNGEIAPPEIREKYINKSLAHTKKKGAANPIKYKL